MNTVNVPLVRHVEVQTLLRGPAGIAGPAGGIPVFAIDPAEPTDGLVYYNSTSQVVRYWTNTDGWQQLLEVGDNAVTASEWETARTLLLDGDADGSVVVDGSQDVVLTVTVPDLAGKADTAALGSAAFAVVTDFDQAGTGAAAGAAAETYADVQDDAHSAADREYADTQSDSARNAAVAAAQNALDAHTATLGSAATTDSSDYATAAQGAKADDAVAKTGQSSQEVEGDLSTSGSVSSGYGQPVWAPGPGGFFTGGAVEAETGSFSGTVEVDRLDAASEVTVQGSRVAIEGHQHEHEHLYPQTVDAAQWVQVQGEDVVVQPQLNAHVAPTSSDHDGRYTPSTQLADVATSGAYTDLSGRPTIPTSPDDIGAADAAHSHDLQYDADGSASAAVAAHEGDVNPHSQYAPAGHDHDADYEAAGAVTAHEASHAPDNAITEADHALIDHTGLPGVGAGGGAHADTDHDTFVVKAGDAMTGQLDVPSISSGIPPLSYVAGSFGGPGSSTTSRSAVIPVGTEVGDVIVAVPTMGAGSFSGFTDTVGFVKPPGFQANGSEEFGFARTLGVGGSWYYKVAGPSDTPGATVTFSWSGAVRARLHLLVFRGATLPGDVPWEYHNGGQTSAISAGATTWAAHGYTVAAHCTMLENDPLSTSPPWGTHLLASDPSNTMHATFYGQKETAGPSSAVSFNGGASGWSGVGFLHIPGGDGTPILVNSSLDLGEARIANVADPVDAQDAVTKQYVDGGDPNPTGATGGHVWTADGADGADWQEPGVEEAPEDGTAYARQDAAWVATSGAGHAPDPAGQPDGKWLITQSGEYVFTDQPSDDPPLLTPEIVSVTADSHLTSVTVTVQEGDLLVVYSWGTNTFGSITTPVDENETLSFVSLGSTPGGTQACAAWTALAPGDATHTITSGPSVAEGLMVAVVRNVLQADAVSFVGQIVQASSFTVPPAMPTHDGIALAFAFQQTYNNAPVFTAPDAPWTIRHQHTSLPGWNGSQLATVSTSAGVATPEATFGFGQTDFGGYISLVLKAAADNSAAAVVPPGGTTNQILVKASDDDYDTDWADPPAGGSTEIGPGEWQTPTLLNGWANAGANYEEAAYRKDSFGIVHFRGIITGETETVGTVLFTLPEGYRPAETTLVSLQTRGSTNTQVATVEVGANGDVAIFDNVKDDWLTLTELSFFADGAGPVIFVGGGGGVITVPFSHAGAAVPGVGVNGWWNDTGGPVTLTSARVSAVTPPSSGTLVVDVNVDGVSVLTGPIVLADAQATTVETTFATPQMGEGSMLTVDVDGNTGGASDITIQIGMSI